MTQQLDWAGLPIKPGEAYGGRPENIPKTSGNPPARPAAKQYEVITENDVAEVFGGGSRKLRLAEAAQQLQVLTSTHRTTAYRALRVTGRFAHHLHTDGRMLSWH